MRAVGKPKVQRQSEHLKGHMGAHMSKTLPMLIDRLNTPIGEMLIVADCEGNLRAVDWTDHET